MNNQAILLAFKKFFPKTLSEKWKRISLFSQILFLLV